MAASLIRLRSERALRAEESERIHRAVRSGGVLIFPTDTVYGLGCDAFNEVAVQRIYQIKGRSPGQPFSVHLSDVSEIDEYTSKLTKRQRALIKTLLPGPYTVVLHASSTAPPACVSPEGKIGLRVPDSRSFRLLYEAVKRPLVGTSVNRSGEPPLTNIDEIIEQFSERVDLIISTDEPLSQASSTVIDLTVDPPRALRGKLPPELLRR